MSRDDTEFTAYLAARWAVLVRTLVLWGHPVAEARSIAFEALVRIQPDWRRVHREEDVEVAVWAEVLESRARWLRRADEDAVRAVQAGPAPPGPAEDGLVEQHERLEQVTAALRGMGADERAAVVLGQVAELSADQVADLLDGPVEGPVLPDVDVRLALEAVMVEPLLATEVVAEVRSRRRRLLRRTTAGAAALLLVVAGVGWFLQREEGPSGEVRQAENPLPVAWYADGRLHLDGLTVEVRPVVDLVAVPDGVVMTDDRGAVVMADDQGAADDAGQHGARRGTGGRARQRLGRVGGSGHGRPRAGRARHPCRRGGRPALARVGRRAGRGEWPDRHRRRARLLLRTRQRLRLGAAAGHGVRGLRDGSPTPPTGRG